MQFAMGSGDYVLLVSLVVVAQFLAATWLKARLTSSIKAEYDRQLEEYRYQIRVREQAAKAAEYLALAWRLDEFDSADVYRRANQLGWELALWLPDNLYREMVLGIAKPSDWQNIRATLIGIRRMLLKDPGDLTADQIGLHAPGAGRLTANT